MASEPTLHSYGCDCDRCAPIARDTGLRTFTLQVAGLATGAVLVGLIEAARTLAPLVSEMIR